MLQESIEHLPFLHARHFSSICCASELSMFASGRRFRSDNCQSTVLLMKSSSPEELYKPLATPYSPPLMSPDGLRTTGGGIGKIVRVIHAPVI